MKGIFEFNFFRHEKWLKNNVPYIRTEDACGFIALDEDQSPLGAVIFDNFLHSSAQCTLVIKSPGAIKLGLIDCAGDWLFNQRKKERCFAMVSINNYRSLRLCKRVGFKPFAGIENGFSDGVDMLILKLERGDFNLQPRKQTKKLTYGMARLKHGVA